MMDWQSSGRQPGQGHPGWWPRTAEVHHLRRSRLRTVAHSYLGPLLGDRSPAADDCPRRRLL